VVQEGQSPRPPPWPGLLTGVFNSVLFSSAWVLPVDLLEMTPISSCRCCIASPGHATRVGESTMMIEENKIVRLVATDLFYLMCFSNSMIHMVSNAPLFFFVAATGG
jgi:hypothetical protein